MSPALKDENRRCLRKWMLKGVDVSDKDVRAVLHNTKDKHSKEYFYTEEMLLIKIKRVKRIPPGQNARHLMSILTAALLTVRKHKMRHGFYF